MNKDIAACCTWTPSGGYISETPFGEINMFDEGGHRAVELMLLSLVSCLNYFLVEYAKSRNYNVNTIQCECKKQMVERPERVGQITMSITIDCNIEQKDKQKMVEICERSCKVMNTLKNPPQCDVVIN